MKKLLAMSVVLCAAAAVHADLLYFMTIGYTPDGPQYFDYARIGVANSKGAIENTYLTLVDGVGGTPASQWAEAAERYTAGPAWADLGDYASSEYSFYVETWAKEGDVWTPIWDYDAPKAMSYDQLLAANHIYRAGVTDPQDVTPWHAAPEPTSGVLLLFGLASLALRRRRRNLPVALILITFSFFLLPSPFSSSAFAAADDTLISFATPGPDKYADGTVVKDGECYALVWTENGSTFGGFAADGTSVDAKSKVLVCAPLAKGGRCPSVLFELEAEFAGQLTGGDYALYLLDTRLADGTLGGVGAKGLPVAVNGWGEVEKAGEGGQRTDSASRTSVSVTTKSALPANTPRPQITAIRLAGDKVLLTVKNTIPCLQYAAREVKVDGETTSQTPQTSTQGASSVDEEITVIAPKKGDSALFTVGRE